MNRIVGIGNNLYWTSWRNPAFRGLRANPRDWEQRFLKANRTQITPRQTGWLNNIEVRLGVRDA